MGGRELSMSPANLGSLSFTSGQLEDTVSLFDSSALLPCPLVPPPPLGPWLSCQLSGSIWICFPPSPRPGVSSRRDAFQHTLWLQQEAHWFLNLLVQDDEPVDDGEKFSAHRVRGTKGGTYSFFMLL